jgi:hypothetical protein
MLQRLEFIKKKISWGYLIHHQARFGGWVGVKLGLVDCNQQSKHNKRWDVKKLGKCNAQI